MSREHVLQRAEGVRNHHGARRLRVAVVRVHRIHGHTALQLVQRRSQSQRVAGQTCAVFVGIKFAGAANSHLNNLRSNGRQQRNHKHGERVRAFTVAAGTTEHRAKRKNLRNRTDNGGNTRRHGGGKDIAVVHVHELVAEHAAHLALIQQLQNTLGAAHRRILRVTTGRERIRGHGRRHVKSRHGLTRAGGQLLHNVVKHRNLFTADRVSIHGTQSKLIGVPVGVRDRTQAKQAHSPDENGGAESRRKQATDEQHHAHHGAHQQGSFQSVVMAVHGYPPEQLGQCVQRVLDSIEYVQAPAGALSGARIHPERHPYAERSKGIRE